MVWMTLRFPSNDVILIYGSQLGVRALFFVIIGRPGVCDRLAKALDVATGRG